MLDVAEWREPASLARKLATILHRMWVDKADFHFGREQSADLAIKAITIVAA